MHVINKIRKDLIELMVLFVPDERLFMSGRKLNFAIDTDHL